MDQMDQSGWGWAWFALALVNAGLAEQKNRSRLVWFLVSLIFGPLATALIVVWRPPAETGPVESLHPFTDARDRFAVFTPLLVLVAFFGGIVAYASPQPWALVGIGVCIGALVAFVVLLVGGMRARERDAKPADDR